MLMCEGCAATTPELPPSAFQATQPACDPTDAELTADEALAAAAHGDGMDAAGYAGAVEDYLHQPYLTRRTWSVEEHEGSEEQNAPWARVAFRWLMSGMARGCVHNALSNSFKDAAVAVQVRPTLLSSYAPDDDSLFSLGVASTYYDIPGRAPRCTFAARSLDAAHWHAPSLNRARGRTMGERAAQGPRIRPRTTTGHGFRKSCAGKMAPLERDRRAGSRARAR